MNTNTINLSEEESKRRAWTLRQKDTGWGRVAAQSYVPFYAIYYGITRRTITPWLHCFAAVFATTLFVQAFYPEKSEKQSDDLVTLAALATAPIGFKIGTDRAREFAKQKLSEQ